MLWCWTTTAYPCDKMGCGEVLSPSISIDVGDSIYID